MNVHAFCQWAFGIGFVSLLHATIAGGFALALAFGISRRSAPLGHCIVMAGAICLLLLPLFATVVRDNALWKVPSASLGSVDTPATDPATSIDSLSDDLASQPLQLPTSTDRLLPKESSNDPEMGMSLPREEVSDSPTNSLTTTSTQAEASTSTLVEESRLSGSPSPALPPAPPLSNAPSSVPWPTIALAVWLAGFVMFALRLVASILHLRGLTRRAMPVPVEGDVRILASLARISHVPGIHVVPEMQVAVSSEIDRPLLWGWRIPTLLLPQSHSAWSDQDFELILSHEWAHAVRGDHRSRILLAVMRCVYWFHPVAWMLERLGGTLAEYSADDLCVSRGRSALSLGDCLLRFASADAKSPSVSFASFRALRKRLERLALERSSSAPLQPVQRWLAPAFAMGLALMISFSIGIGNSTNATEASVNRAAIQRLEQQQRSLREVIASMHSLPGWEHLPLDLEEQVLSQPLSGPEFNVDVRLVDEQGDPVMNALCAIIENEFEQINRSGYLLMQHEELPLALGATDSNGGVFLRNVRGRQPSTNLNGIVGPVLVILHPEYGIRFSRLARSNRIQKVDLTLESPVHIAGDVATEEGEVVPELPLVVTMFHGPIEGAAEFHEAHFSRSILLPKPKTSSDGSYVLSGLPPEWDCSVSLYPDSRIAAYQPIAIARRGLKFIPTQTRNHDIVVKRSDRPSLVFRCVNADGRESPPLPKAVGLPGQSSFTVDIDGNIVTRSYRSGGGDGSGHMIYDLALQMPLPWVSMRYFRHALDCDEPFEIAVKRGRIVRGKIIDAVALAPLVGVDVRAVPPRPEVLPQQPKWPRDHLMVTASRTNRDGSFEFAITDEAWSLYVDGPIYGYDLPESMLGTRSVIINEWPHVQVIQAGEGDEEIVIALQPQPRLRGRVLDENGQPLANALVSCSYRITERNESVATTNALGEFELLPPPQRLLKNPSPQKNERGPFAYTPPPDDFTYQVSVTSDTGRATLRLPENWRKAANEPLEIVLQPRPGLRTLEGNVFLDGVGVPDFEVGITEGNRPPLDSGSHFEMWQSVNNAIVARAKTDAEGRYRIEIPESEFGMADFYILSTIQNGLLPPRPLPDPYIHRTREETKVSLDGERNVGPDLKFLFKPGTQSIRGRVQSVDGKPFAGANISLRPQKEVEGIPLKEDVVPRERKTVSQSDGSFEFTNLLPGEYFVQGMTPYTGSKWKLWVGVNCKAGDSDVILIMDQKFLEPPEKIAPQSIR